MSEGHGREAHGHGPGDHQHGALDHEMLSNRAGVRAVWISALGLGITAAFQLGIVAISGSVGLLSDALHNVGDVLGTLTLLLAFTLARRPASATFPFGWRRAEDLGGLIILLAIAASAVLAGWESVSALLGEGHEVRNLPAAFAAAVVGVIGNEGVARYKIAVGRRIDSPALIADGQHARTDGLVSAGAAVGILGAAAGFPRTDAIAGLVITMAIVYVMVDVGREVLRRLVDGVRPGVLEALETAASGVADVQDVHDVRARHAGRAMFVQLHIGVDPELTVREAHRIAEEVRWAVVRAGQGVASVDVHVDPAGEHEAAHQAMTTDHPDLDGR